MGWKMKVTFTVVVGRLLNRVMFGTLALFMASTCTVALPALADQTEGTCPKGWYVSGSAKDYYVSQLEPGVTHDNLPVASIKFRQPKDRGPLPSDGFGTVMQNFDAKNYTGKRVRFSGLVSTKDVTDGAGLWLRIDGLKGSLGFDNMQDDKRRLHGTSDFTPCSLVLDVPSEASSIALGVLLNGKGDVSVCKLKFETVGLDVPVTANSNYPPEPRNLDFKDKN